MWLAGALSLNDEGGPVNPLKWWMRQRRAGNTHGGLLQMALDVLSCPATTVDVERSFSFGRDYVSLRRHRLSASSLTRGMAVLFYAKNGKIQSGVLRKWKLNKKNEQKQKGKVGRDSSFRQRPDSLQQAFRNLAHSACFPPLSRASEG
ncbi:hypothetical protein PGTUg99_014835 [Puccinia graminis f. sp. tritici]|uniref:HAT C-terminal dimerisation domain-containing protein n=1 Tax=Puccinia graminis f. sp. tritici TaxID=56615 RepID=A0A5B0QHB3_PUCGR|nr:hypothetical protein PGTUg99_014835 [Puccinia graminis f. sp. tritici]